MFRLCRILPLNCVGLFLVAATSVVAEPEGEVGVWQKVSSYLTKEALIELKDLPEATTPATRREREFCWAVVTLDQQPLSESRLDDVEERLQALLAMQGDDEIAAASRYLLGRIAQIYRGSPQMESAANSSLMSPM